MEKETPTQQPEAKTPPPLPNGNKVRIELEYNMLTNNLVMRSGYPTVIVSAVLRNAEVTQPKEIEETAPGAPRRIFIDYDMKTNTCSVETDAAILIYTGILVMAHSMVTQNQIFQRIQAAQAKSRIVGPGGARVS